MFKFILIAILILLPSLVIANEFQITLDNQQVFDCKYFGSNAKYIYLQTDASPLLVIQKDRVVDIKKDGIDITKNALSKQYKLNYRVYKFLPDYASVPDSIINIKKVTIGETNDQVYLHKISKSVESIAVFCWTTLAIAVIAGLIGSAK